MMSKPYVILGGGGAFGLTLAKYLLSLGERERVICVGRNPLRPGAFSLGLEGRSGFEYRQFHIRHELDLLLGFLDEVNPGVIVNFAAQGEGAASWEHSWRFFDTNATALCRLYEALVRERLCRRFIHIGTSELYGSVDAPVTEDAPIRVSSPYSASKAAFDLYLLSMMRAKRTPISTVILRPSNCYCPGQLLHRIIPRAVVAGLTGRRVPLHGGGTARKSYMHAIDLARAVRLVAEIDVDLLSPVYNLGPRAPISIREVAAMVATVVGVPFHDLFDEAPERVGQDACYWLDSSRAARELAWEPTVGWGNGLLSVARWARENIEQLRAWPIDYRLHA